MGENPYLKLYNLTVSPSSSRRDGKPCPPPPPPRWWEGGPRTPRRLIWKTGSSSGHARGLTRLWLPASVSSCWSASLSGPLGKGLWEDHWLGSSPLSQWDETPRACGKLCREVAAAARFPHGCGLSFLFRRRPHPEPLPTRAPQLGVLPPSTGGPVSLLEGCPRPLESLCMGAWTVRGRGGSRTPRALSSLLPFHSCSASTFIVPQIVSLPAGIFKLPLNF